MRYHVHMAAEPEEPLSTTLSPGDNRTKGACRGLEGPVLDGTPLGLLVIEGINNNYALPLTVLAAVIFTPDFTPVDTNPVGHRSHAHSLDPVPISNCQKL